MSCCAPGAEFSIRVAALPSNEEIWLASRDLSSGLRQNDLSVPGIHCGACIIAIEDALNARPEIAHVRVNLSTKRVSLVWREAIDNQPTDPQSLLRVIHASGYEAHLFSHGVEENDALKNQLIRGVAVAGFAATNIMLLSVSVWSGADAATRDLFHWISAMIAAPALIYSGRFFFHSAWNALKHGRTNMDVPISLAVILSYAMSLWETIHHGQHAWFDATVSLLFFLLIGRVLDHVMRDRARSAIVGLARLSPRGAMVIGEDGTRDYRAVADILPGEKLLVSAGERIPVDCTVLSGVSDLDCSIVNGESAPVPVVIGMKLLAGTLNLTGSLMVKASATASQSFLAEIIHLIEAAEGGRARYRRIADRAARYYSPAVHALALVSLLGWGMIGGDWKQAMLVAVSVLIITCPCALGLAVPVVQVIAAGRLFENGIMVKDGSAMERLGEVDHVFFDKTGTLTLGRPRVTNRAAISQEALVIAASLAAHSRHPMSEAITRVQRGDPGRFENPREIGGSGLEARDASGVWRLGNRIFATGQDREGSPGNQSESVLSLNGNEIACFLMEDVVRPGASALIEDLAMRGMGREIISGDREAVVGRLAARLGIASWKSGLTPLGKVAAIQNATQNGAKVLMVGDGINDAPALGTAHVSIAPSSAADIGRQAADFVFMREGLESISLAMDVSRKADRLIRENFALAIGYNIIAVPIAIMGQATPLIAAIAMSTSSIIVVANSMRLRAGPKIEAENAGPHIKAEMDLETEMAT